MSRLKTFTTRVDAYHVALDALIEHHNNLMLEREALLKQGTEDLGLGAMPLNREIKKTKLIVWTPGQVSAEEEKQLVDEIAGEQGEAGDSAPSIDAGDVKAAQ